MKLIPNAKKVALHSYSQNAQAAAVTLIGGYQLLPDKLQDALPVGAVMGLACVVLVLGWIGRLVQQPALHEPPKDEA